MNNSSTSSQVQPPTFGRVGSMPLAPLPLVTQALAQPQPQPPYSSSSISSSSAAAMQGNSAGLAFTSPVQTLDTAALERLIDLGRESKHTRTSNLPTGEEEKRPVKPKRRKVGGVDLSDLNEEEKSVYDWCRQAGFAFNRPESDNKRVDADHKERVCYYVDANVDTAMRRIQELKEDCFAEDKTSLSDWVFKFDANIEWFAAYRAYLVARTALIQHDLDPKHKLKNKNRRADILFEATRAERVWKRAMTKKCRDY